MTPPIRDIERAIRSWVAQGSGLPSESVIPGNDDGPAPDYPYATVLPIDQELAGVPWGATRLAATDIAYTDIGDALQAAWRQLPRASAAGVISYPYAQASVDWRSDHYLLTYPAGIAPRAFDAGPLADAMGISGGAAAGGNAWQGTPVSLSPTYIGTRPTAGLSVSYPLGGALVREYLPPPSVATGLLAVTITNWTARYSVQWYGDDSVWDYALRFSLWAHSPAGFEAAQDFWLGRVMALRQLDDVRDDVMQAQGWERRVGLDLEIGYHQELSLAGERFDGADVALAYYAGNGILRARVTPA